MENLIFVFLITIGSYEKGKEIFVKKCSACHTIGEGKRVGPDLMGITEIRNIEWLKKFINKPSLFFGKDKLADSLLKVYGIKMPDQNLEEEEILSILEYLNFSSKKEIKVEEKKEIKITKEEIPFNKEKYERGKMLFKGEIIYKNKGLPCISCHTVKGIFTFGGGKVGPDLSFSYENYGAEGLELALKDIPFPTMIPVYKNKPLLDEEIEALIYFLSKLETKN
ncbi:MAG: cytochrome c, partial [Candidatus Omnitrophica bacterium]|nr:cytochrome c [Candidatus Omnitrophota bacterium]